MIKSNSN